VLALATILASLNQCEMTPYLIRDSARGIYDDEFLLGEGLVIRHVLSRCEWFR
jgi:hypothetical protein